MDYEQEYKKALERAKDYFKANQRIGELEENDILSDIFPELKESEDEKMRKSIIYALRNGGFYDSDKTDEAIAWLEKQGKQKSIWHDVNEEPEKYRELLCEWYAKGDINYLTPFHDIAFYHRSDKTFWNGKQQIKNVIKWAYLDEMYDEQSQSYLAPKSARQAINEEKVDNANKVEPKFKVGDWITIK